MVEGQGQDSIVSWLQKTRAGDDGLYLTATSQGTGNRKGEGEHSPLVMVTDNKNSKIHKIQGATFTTVIIK